MSLQLVQAIQDKVFGTMSDVGFFYEALQSAIPLQAGEIGRNSPYELKIVIHDSTSLAQESVSSDTIVNTPKKSTRVKAYNKKTDLGTIRISAHIRNLSKPTIKQRVKSVLSKDKAPFKQPEVNINEIITKALTNSFQRLSYSKIDM